MALITLQEAKDFLQITTTVSDALISSYIQMVSSEIEAYCDRTFAIGTYSQPLHLKQSQFDFNTDLPLNFGTIRAQARLRQTPVVDFKEITSNSVTVSDNNYTVDNDNGVVTFYQSVSDYKDKLVANYVSGYATTDVPQNLKLVAKQGVKTMFENGGVAKERSGNVSSKSLKDFSVSYGNKQTGLYTNVDGLVMKTYLAGNRVILDRYKHIEL